MCHLSKRLDIFSRTGLQGVFALRGSLSCSGVGGGGGGGSSSSPPPPQPQAQSVERFWSGTLKSNVTGKNLTVDSVTLAADETRMLVAESGILVVANLSVAGTTTGEREHKGSRSRERAAWRVALFGSELLRVRLEAVRVEGTVFLPVT
jgi:hypothetical protein